MLPISLLINQEINRWHLLNRSNFFLLIFNLMHYTVYFVAYCAAVWCDVCIGPGFGRDINHVTALLPLKCGCALRM